jgi:hypothetical protein
MHRYLPAIASQLGNRVIEVEVGHRPRRFGRSKYGLSRTFQVLTDLVRLRARMREAVDPAPAPPLYDIAQVLDGPRVNAPVVSERRLSAAASEC